MTTALDQAKQKFLASAGAADPLNAVRRYPLVSVGVACLTGVALGSSKVTARAALTLAELFLSLIRSYLETDRSRGA